MAVTGYQAVRNTDNSHTVTRVTAASTVAIGSADAVIGFDDTLTDKVRLLEALNAAVRALSRDLGKNSKPSTVTASGTSTE